MLETSLERSNQITLLRSPAIECILLPAIPTHSVRGLMEGPTAGTLIKAVVNVGLTSQSQIDSCVTGR